MPEARLHASLILEEGRLRFVSGGLYQVLHSTSGVSQLRSALANESFNVMISFRARSLKDLIKLVPMRSGIPHLADIYCKTRKPISRSRMLPCSAFGSDRLAPYQTLFELIRSIAIIIGGLSNVHKNLRVKPATWLTLADLSIRLYSTNKAGSNLTFWRSRTVLNKAISFGQRGMSMFSRKLVTLRRD